MQFRGEYGPLISKQMEIQSVACALRRYKQPDYFVSSIAQLCLCCRNQAVACDVHLLLCNSEP